MPSAYLKPLLRADLCVVFVGTEPGPTSLRTGNYYANPDNSFWHDLDETDLTDGLLTPNRYQELLTFSIGLDDVYLDARGLRMRLERVAPSAVCFNSKGALQRMTDRSIGPHWMGRQAADWVAFAGIETVWALPDSSPRAQRLRSTRLSLLRELQVTLKDCLRRTSN